MYLLYNALAILLTLLLPLAQALASSPPDITFLCDQIPDICTNMCWAVRCAQPRFPLTLTLDLDLDLSDSHSRSNSGVWISRTYRNMTASCPTNMMCGLHGAAQPGHRDCVKYRSCNMFPFPQTQESALQRGHQVSRCVPEAQQREQNAQLSLLSRSLQLHLLEAKKKTKKIKGGVLRARINFGNPGGVPYCDNRPCQNDGFQVQDGAVTSRAKGEDVALKYYKTSAGMTLASVEEIETPFTFHRPVGKDKVIPAGMDAWYEFGYAGQRVRLMGDVVVERLNGSDY